MGYGDPPEREGANSSCHRKSRGKGKPLSKRGLDATLWDRKSVFGKEQQTTKGNSEER